MDFDVTLVASFFLFCTFFKSIVNFSTFSFLLQFVLYVASPEQFDKLYVNRVRIEAYLLRYLLLNNHLK